MPWKETCVMEQRIKFVVRAVSGQESMSGLCREFGISRPTGYLWLGRYRRADSITGVKELSRRPHRTPYKTSDKVERQVVELRRRYGWGAKKIRCLLKERRVFVPLITANRIIKRNGLIKREDSHRPAIRRFERYHPNELWQMDFKGEFSVTGGYCYPLTIIDDHSRYGLGIFALTDRKGETVWKCLVRVFNSYGMPQAILMDHGSPWWSTNNGHGLTALSINLIKQGVKLYWSGIAHPQTQGKIERFHRTLKHDILHLGRPQTIADWSRAFERFLYTYNHIRPHESLVMGTPAKHYIPSPKAFDPHPMDWVYPVGAVVKRLNSQGMLEYNRKRYFVCEALSGERVQIETLDKKVLIRYRHMYIREIELKTMHTKAIITPAAGNLCVNHVLKHAVNDV